MYYRIQWRETCPDQGQVPCQASVIVLHERFRCNFTSPYVFTDATERTVTLRECIVQYRNCLLPCWTVLLSRRPHKTKRHPNSIFIHLNERNVSQLTAKESRVALFHRADVDKAFLELNVSPYIRTRHSAPFQTDVAQWSWAEPVRYDSDL